MNISLPYLGRLDKERQQVFEKLAVFSDRYILAGGTAIMLQIGHRLSYDFDLFAKDKPTDNLLRKIQQVFGNQVKPYLRTDEILSVKTPDDIEITFVWHPFTILQKPLQTGYLPLFHLDDLAANKAYTIGRRGAWRDYVDLFFLLKWKFYTLEKLVNLANKKFTGEFHDKLFLEQLTFFDDVEIIPTNFLKESYTDSEIKSFLEQQVKVYLKKVLPE